MNRIKSVGPGPRNLLGLTHLRTLELRVNEVTDHTLQCLGELKQLETLDLGNSRLVNPDNSTRSTSTTRP